MKPQKLDVARHWWTTCACGKRSYPTRKAARRTYRSKHPDGGLNAYQCHLNPGVWHYGHLQPGDREDTTMDIGEAIVRVEYDQAGGRRVVVDRADPLILVSRPFLEGVASEHYDRATGVLTLDTAGEYRYRPLRDHDDRTVVFQRWPDWATDEEAAGA